MLIASLRLALFVSDNIENNKCRATGAVGAQLEGHNVVPLRYRQT